MRHSECHNSGFVSPKDTSGFSLCYKVMIKKDICNTSNNHQALALLSGQVVNKNPN